MVKKKKKKVKFDLLEVKKKVKCGPETEGSIIAL